MNGKTSLGETVGSVHALCGLFLFPAEQDDDTVTRWFVPADAIRSMSIGKPLGEMLVDGHSPRAEVVDAAQRQQAMRSRRSATTSPSTRSCRPSSSRRAQAAARAADPEARRGAGRAGLPHRSRARGSPRHRGARPQRAARPDPRRHGGGRRRDRERGDGAQARHSVREPEGFPHPAGGAQAHSGGGRARFHTVRSPKPTMRSSSRSRTRWTWRSSRGCASSPG